MPRCTPDPAAVDEPHLAQAGGVSFVQVLFDDGRNVARREGVKVEEPSIGIRSGS